MKPLSLLLFLLCCISASGQPIQRHWATTNDAASAAVGAILTNKETQNIKLSGNVTNDQILSTKSLLATNALLYSGGQAGSTYGFSVRLVDNTVAMNVAPSTASPDFPNGVTVEGNATITGAGIITATGFTNTGVGTFIGGAVFTNNGTMAGQGGSNIVAVYTTNNPVPLLAVTTNAVYVNGNETVSGQVSSPTFLGTGSSAGTLILSNSAGTAFNNLLSGSNIIAVSTLHSNNVLIDATHALYPSNVGVSKLAGTDAGGAITNIVVGSGLALVNGALSTNGQTSAGSSGRVFGSSTSLVFNNGNPRSVTFDGAVNLGGIDSNAGQSIGSTAFTVSDPVFTLVNLGNQTNVWIILYTNGAASNYSNNVVGTGVNADLTIAGSFTIPANAKAFWLWNGNNSQNFVGYGKWSFKQSQ